jgi:hypothetical protein
VKLHEDLGRARVLQHGGSVVPAVGLQPPDNENAEPFADLEVVGSGTGQLHVHARTDVATSDVAQLEAEGAETVGEIRVGVESLLDVLGIDVRP